MTDKRWVCVTCSEGFTRRSSADRHIRNIHSGLAETVRLVDYIIGRLAGKYSPADPSIYRHIKRQHSMSKLSVVMSHEKVSAVHHLHPQPHPQGYQLPAGVSDQGTKIGVGQAFSNNFLESEGVEKKNFEGHKIDVCGISVRSSRLEEVKNLLMLFSPPGDKPSPVVEKTLADLSSLILSIGGNDSFLEGPLKGLRNCVRLSDAVGLLYGPSGMGLRKDRQTYVPASKLPGDAIDKMTQIQDLLSECHHPMFVQTKINELVTSYYRTGDSSVFDRALANCLNSPV